MNGHMSEEVSLLSGGSRNVLMAGPGGSCAGGCAALGVHRGRRAAGQRVAAAAVGVGNHEGARCDDATHRSPSGLRRPPVGAAWPIVGYALEPGP